MFLIAKAPLAFLSLLIAARHDSRSWIKCLQTDLEWMTSISSDFAFTMPQWIEMCRDQPKAARSLIRKCCDKKEARTTSHAALLAVLRGGNGFSCPCGWNGHTLQAYHAHLWQRHHITSPVQSYLNDELTCPTCLIVFSSRQLLQNHLSRGFGATVCLLNAVVRSQPLSVQDLVAHRSRASDIITKNIHCGLPAYHASKPPMISFGPLWQLFRVDGTEILWSHKDHPYFRGKCKRYLPSTI